MSKAMNVFLSLKPAFKIAPAVITSIIKKLFINQTICILNVKIIFY